MERSEWKRTRCPTLPPGLVESLPREGGYVVDGGHAQAVEKRAVVVVYKSVVLGKTVVTAVEKSVGLDNATVEVIHKSVVLDKGHCQSH